MLKIIEIVPNFSEGKNHEIMEKIVAPFNCDGINLLDLEMDPSYNRSVVTIIGEAKVVCEKMLEASIIAIKLIDLRVHSGEHPRMGAIDVLPLIPIANITEEETIELSKELAKKIHEATNVPIYLYSKSATKASCVSLPDIRKGEFEGLALKMQTFDYYPDFGDPVPHESAGALAVGVRNPLVAFNIDTNSNKKAVIAKIARRVRLSGGGYRSLQANAARVKELGICQVSMNLTNYLDTALYQALEAVKMEAKRYNIEITSSEIVGLVSKECLLNSLKYYLNLDDEETLDLSLEEICDLSIKHFKLRDFSVKKIIEYYIH